LRSSLKFLLGISTKPWFASKSYEKEHLLQKSIQLNFASPSPPRALLKSEPPRNLLYVLSARVARRAAARTNALLLTLEDPSVT